MGHVAKLFKFSTSSNLVIWWFDAIRVRHREGDHLVPKIPNNLEQNGQYENCSHFWDFLKIFENMFTNTFKPCYHIELNTQNPNTIIKITICYTKYPQNVKTLSNILESFWTCCKHPTKIYNIRKTIKQLFCYLYKLHNSYFVFFNFCNFRILHV